MWHLRRADRAGAPRGAVGGTSLQPRHCWSTVTNPASSRAGRGFKQLFIQLIKASMGSSRFAGSLCVSDVHFPSPWEHTLGRLPRVPCTGAGETRGPAQSLCTSLVAFKQCFKEKHNTQGLFWHTAVQKTFWGWRETLGTLDAGSQRRGNRTLI